MTTILHLDSAARSLPAGAAPGLESPTESVTSRVPVDSDALLSLVRQRLDDDKAEDIVTVDLHGKSSICDYMVIASGRSQRQVASMAEHLGRIMQSSASRRPSIEGLPHGDWVLIDGGDVIVHLFRPEVRRFYNLEKMWGIDLPETAAEPAEPRPEIALGGLA